MLKLAVGVTVVVTVLEVLFPVFRSNCDPVMVAKFDNVHHVALTVHVMVIEPTHQLNRLHMFKVNTFHAMLHVEATSPVNHVGSVSEITIHVAVAGQALA
jgi:pentose-5-phosphate-3-epimerase